ncbi:MAG: type II toxin-antitoxin system VapC family toxin [Thermodesulfobacteriota bacterium]|nr:type II toxin-antitoxin system VapC family toxin [Thermodesulfobacteriota bacterium]
MKISYLIDTDWIIHYLNGSRNIVAKLRSLEKDGLTISVISLAELYEGIYYSTNPDGNERALNDFLSGVSVIGVEDVICRLFGKERGRLRQAKKMIGDFDLLIASTCLHHNLTLLTNNRKHYKMVEGLKILSLL